MGVVGHDFNGDAADGGIVGGADGEGLNIIALAGKHAGDQGENAGLVVHQHGKGLARYVVHVPTSY